jgi:single-strand DNA-binding protein
VTTIRLATNRVWNNQATGQKQEATEFHTIVAWGRLAEIASQYLKKGAMALFEGRLQTRSWDDKTTGAKRYMTEIVAENLQMGPRAAGSGPAVSDVKRPSAVRSEPAEPAIPIIGEDEITEGIGEATVKDVDLPF